MKKLQYIKLFEAFDSKILSGTLNYIKNKSSKDSFLTDIKNVCESIDYPISKLSDDFFEYLPFKKALEKAGNNEDEPCEGDSVDIFSTYGIEGETCKNGKIKRKWGKGTRNVSCEVCSGTGIKPKKSEIKLIKFWFDKDGISKGMTVVDGDIHKTRWTLKDDVEGVINPYSWNFGFRANRDYYNKINTYIDHSKNIQEQIKGANFGIILDFSKLKKTSFDKKSDLMLKRRTVKMGSKLDIYESDENIRKKNIERYLGGLSKNIDFSGINDCKKIILRSLGHSKSLYLIYSSNLTSTLANIISYYSNILDDSISLGDKDYYTAQLKSLVSTITKNGMDESDELRSKINSIKNIIKSDQNSYVVENVSKFIELIDTIEDLSLFIYKKINKKEVECIEDIEIIYNLIVSIKSVLQTNRYSSSYRTFAYFVDKFYDYSVESSYRYLVDEYYVNLDKTLIQINKIKYIIEKL